MTILGEIFLPPANQFRTQRSRWRQWLTDMTLEFCLTYLMGKMANQDASVSEKPTQREIATENITFSNQENWVTNLRQSREIARSTRHFGNI
jgi:hypothetical protein